MKRIFPIITKGPSSHFRRISRTNEHRYFSSIIPSCAANPSSRIKDRIVDVDIADPKLSAREPFVIERVLGTGVNLESLPEVHQLVYQVVREVYPDENEDTQRELERVINKNLERIRREE